MPNYDTLYPPTQLGDPLQNYSSHGWNGVLQDNDNNANVETWWDGIPVLRFGERVPLSGNLVQWSFVDMCVHQGELHAVWVEPQWNGGPARPDPRDASDKNMRGPFVKKWDGSNWVSLGGEVEPSLTPVNMRWRDYYTINIWASTNIALLGLGPIGTRSGPSRPKIVSDGENLFVAYCVREITAAPEYPPVGSRVFINAALYRTVVGTDYQQWMPRKVYVRKWNPDTSEWDLYGDIPAISNNYCTTTYVGYSGESTTFSGGGDISEISIDCPQDGSGVVYVGWMEIGARGSATVYVAPPVHGSPPDGYWTFKGTRATCHFVRFDGSDTLGEDHQIRPVLTEDGVINGGGRDVEIAFNAAVDNIQAVTAWPSQPVVGARGTRAYMFWTDYQFDFPFANQIRMTRWSDLVDVQTIDRQTLWPHTVAHDPLRNLYYVATWNTGVLYQIADNGSGGFNIVSATIRPFGGSEADPWIALPTNIISDGLNNIWGISSYRTTVGEYQVCLYHRPCEYWESHGFAGGGAGLIGAGWSVIAQIDDTIYTLGAYRDRFSTATDLTIRCFAFDICRDCLSCGGVPVHDPFPRLRIPLDSR